MPVEALTKLASTDKACAEKVGQLVLPHVMQLFTNYHQDAMLSSDIITLIKMLGDVDDTSAFRAAVLPQIQKSV